MSWIVRNRHVSTDAVLSEVSTDYASFVFSEAEQRAAYGAPASSITVEAHVPGGETARFSLNVPAFAAPTGLLAFKRTSGDLALRWTPVLGGSWVVRNFNVNTGATISETVVSQPEWIFSEAEQAAVYGFGTVYLSATVTRRGGGMSTFSGAAVTSARDLVGRMSVAPYAGRKSQIDRLVERLVASGLWAKIDALWLCAAHDAQAARLNWKADKYNLTVVNSVPFTPDIGFKNAAGTTGSYLRTGFIGGQAGDNWTLASASAGVVVKALGTNSERTVMGASQLNPEPGIIDPGVRFMPAYNAGGGGGGVNTSSNSALVGPAWTASGSYFATRTNTTSTELYLNGVLRGTSSTAARANVLELYLLAENFNGAPAFYSDETLGAAFTGGGLTATEIGELHSAISQYMASLGG